MPSFLDFVSLSFVQSVEDVRQARAFLREHGGEAVRLVAKIEKLEAVEGIEAILDEVDGISIARGDLGLELPSMRCVGYRQAWEMLDGSFPPQELAERGSAATRQLAKRQLTWLRSMPWRTVVPCDTPGSEQAVLQAVRQWQEQALAL